MSYELHPLCTLLPRMSDEELRELAADIERHGQKHDIVLLGGKILDGRHRFLACGLIEVEPRVREFDPAIDGHPALYVLRENVLRRHMTAGQRAVTAALLYQAAMVSGDREAARTAAEIAESAQVTDRYQRLANAVVNASPDMAQKVLDGDMSLEQAARTSGVMAPRKTPRNEAEAASGGKPVDDEAEAASAMEVDTVELLKEMQADIDRLEALVKAAEADDAKAEVIKWRRLADHAQRAQSDAMDNAARCQKREAWVARQLARCGKAVGETDTDRIAPAVEAFVRAYKPRDAA